MADILSIARYEIKMLLTRIASWTLLGFTVVFSLLDSFPSSANLHRLEFLTDPAYFVYRTMSLNGLILAFALMFLLSNRLSTDRDTGVKDLFMAGPVTKGQYLLGKLLGGFGYTALLFALFLTANALVYLLASPFQVEASSLAAALGKSLLICALPVSFFVSAVSVCLPGLMDVRVFYALAAVLFIANAFIPGSAEAMPFFCITSGDLTRLIWQHPKWPFTDTWSIGANLLFLIGSGLASWGLLLVRKHFWREEK